MSIRVAWPHDAAGVAKAATCSVAAQQLHGLCVLHTTMRCTGHVPSVSAAFNAQRGSSRQLACSIPSQSPALSAATAAANAKQQP